MVDIIIQEDWGEYRTFFIFELKNGKKELVKSIQTFNYMDAIDYINENYDYARVLCGRCI